MASSSSSQALLSWLLFASLLFTFTNSSPIPSATKSSKVDLNLYYESLCPACQSFIVEDLVRVFNTDLQTIVNLRLVPYGNAQVINNTIVCQHGEDECYLNAIEACAIKIRPEPKKHFGFIHCVESSLKSLQQHAGKSVTVWKKCAEKYGGPKSIENCYNSGLANQLILGYANETDSLQPPHEYVPWLTVNKKPLFEKIEDFVAEVCKAYKGARALPKACKSSASSELAEKNLSPIQVCYVGEARS